MRRVFSPVIRVTRRRWRSLPLLAVLAGAACQDSSPLATSAPTDPPTAATPADQPADTGTAVDSQITASVTYTGLPYGLFGLWASATTFDWGPAPFTVSQDNTFANSIITRINTARLKRQRLVLAMTGGNSTEYTTNGKFDFTKWKNRMNTFKTTAIKTAVAAGVADGTIVGNSMMDEPETPKWGGVMTKPLIDQMALYVKNIFPSLPVGVNQGAPGYQWRTFERYRVLDYVLYNYRWQNNQGNVTAWRDNVLAQARVDGVTPAFSLSILDGGVPDTQGSWDCAGTGGKGTYYPHCRMTPDQVRTYGKAVGPAGCVMLNWRYDDAFMSKAANVDAFKDVAATLASKPRRSCKRP
jgi:hypothetical protein